MGLHLSPCHGLITLDMYWNCAHSIFFCSWASFNREEERNTISPIDGKLEVNGVDHITTDMVLKAPPHPSLACKTKSQLISWLRNSSSKPASFYICFAISTMNTTGSYEHDRIPHLQWMGDTTRTVTVCPKVATSWDP